MSAVCRTPLGWDSSGTVLAKPMLTGLQAHVGVRTFLRRLLQAVDPPKTINSSKAACAFSASLVSIPLGMLRRPLYDLQLDHLETPYKP